MRLIKEEDIEDRVKGALSKYEIGFRCGVDFAESKLTPLMIEFALW